MALLHKVFQSFKGLDLRSSDILRSDSASTALTNMMYRQTGAMTKRKGYKWATEIAQGGYGLTTFSNVNLTTGEVTEEVISVDDNLVKLQPYSFTITYSGGGTDRTYYTSIFNETTSTYQFLMYQNSVLVLTHDLGIGNEGGFDAISDLTTAINGITDFACPSADGGTTSPSAYIPVTGVTDITATGTQIVFEVWEDVATPVGLSTPFSTFYAQRTSASFENATFAQMNDVIYIATGHDNLMKYDGNRVYRAGMEACAAITVIDVSGTTFPSTEVHSYFAQYEYKDAKENTITGIPSAIYTNVTGGGGPHDHQATIPNLQDTDFNVDQCVVDGTQAGVTNILVDVGHSIQVGDYLFIDDGITGGVISSKVSALPDTTHVTVSDSVDVSDNDILSTVRISLYRTENHVSTPDAPTLFYIAKEFTNDSSSASFTYTDDLTDTLLSGSIQYVEPIKQHGLPPKCRYIDEWRGQALLAGDLTNVTTVYYSEIGSAEYYPAFANAFDLNRKVTGIKALDNSVYVFKKHSIDGVTGDFATDNFQVDKVSREGVGCSAHATIQEVRGKLFFLSDRGIYSINQEGLEHVGSNIEPKFAINNPFSFAQASAYVWQAEKKYIIQMPQITSGNAYANDAASEIYAYDYFREAWLEFANFNLMGGMTEKNGGIYKMSRDDTQDNSQLHKILSLGNEYDYIDHNVAVNWSYSSPWFNQKEPSVFKKYLRCKLHSYDTTVADFENDTFTITLNSQHDFEVSQNFSTLVYDFSGGALGWGLGAWSNFRWGDIKLPQIQRKLASKKVRALRVILSNNSIYENVLVSGIEFDIATPYRSEMKE